MRLHRDFAFTSRVAAFSNRRMVEQATPAANVRTVSGGRIGGFRETPAFELKLFDPSPIPIVIAAPHAGRAYPPRLLEQMRSAGDAAIRLEDRAIDKVAEMVAERTSASLLVAQAPRAMIDLNRARDEIDWSMVQGGAPISSRARAPGRRVRSGLGLVPRRLPGSGEIWRGPLQSGEIEARIEDVHDPYHKALTHELARLRRRWGAALLIDLHSMPPLPQDDPPKFVLGDRFGAACSAGLSAIVLQDRKMRESGIAHNRPYAGGYVLDRHAAPRKAIHAIQLEVCRSAYLDESMLELGQGTDAVVSALVGLVQTLAGEVSAMGSAEAGKLAAE